MRTCGPGAKECPGDVSGGRTWGRFGFGLDETETGRCVNREANLCALGINQRVSQGTGAVNPAPAPAPRGPDCRLVLGSSRIQRRAQRGSLQSSQQPRLAPDQVQGRSGRDAHSTDDPRRHQRVSSQQLGQAQLQWVPRGPFKVLGVGRPRHPRGRWPRGKQPPSPPDRRRRAQGLYGWPAIESQRCPTHCPGV